MKPNADCVWCNVDEDYVCFYCEEHYKQEERHMSNAIVWWGIKVKKADGTFHYVTDITEEVADAVDSMLDYIDDDNLEEERK